MVPSLSPFLGPETPVRATDPTRLAPHLWPPDAPRRDPSAAAAPPLASGAPSPASRSGAGAAGARACVPLPARGPNGRLAPPPPPPPLSLPRAAEALFVPVHWRGGAGCRPICSGPAGRFRGGASRAGRRHSRASPFPASPTSWGRPERAPQPPSPQTSATTRHCVRRNPVHLGGPWGVSVRLGVRGQG